MLNAINTFSGCKKVFIALFTALLCTTMVLAQTDFQRLYSSALARYGQPAADTIAHWQTLIETIKTIPERDRLKQVNDFFNDHIRFISDIDSWGEKDYWATPLETIGRAQGDCEDFSIAKYATLLLAGIEIDKLRITYVKARIGGHYSKLTQAHMVVAYYPTPTADPLVLDNLISDIRPASQRKDLTPVFGFNSKGLWVGGAAEPTSNNPGAKLSRWRDLLGRMKQDGLQ